MNAMRKLLKSRSGFTLVELMVVVVVLGILAGIAVQRMGDVRDRAEIAAREANTRLLLGAANLAKTRNYGDYMYGNATIRRNGVIRWMRPCEKPAVSEFFSQGSGGTTYGSQYIYYTGYGNIESFPHASLWWTSGQEWNLNDYLESFPIGYAVEIVFAARTPEGDINENENNGINVHGFNAGAYATPSDYSAYNVDQILIYRFNGNIEDNPSDWEDFDYYDTLPQGLTHTSGNNYPYHYAPTHANYDHFRQSWEQLFPEVN